MFSGMKNSNYLPVGIEWLLGLAFYIEGVPL